MRIPRMVLWLAALVMIVSSLPAVNGSKVSAQGADSAEMAIRSVAAGALGGDTDSLVVRLIAETDGWAYGSATLPAAPGDDGPTFRYLLAHDAGNGWVAELRYTDAFNTLLQQAPPDFPNATVRAAINGVNLAGDGSADLSFPFGVGETWNFNGPHPNTVNHPTRPWSSLDFYLYSGGRLIYDAPILAMRGGVVDRPCANMVVIDHGDGWSTVYYHVVNITVSDGQTVSRGQRVGGTSAEFNCGGAADGPHMHIWMTWQGTEIPIAGKDIGGWTVSNGAQPYDGCLTRGTVVKCRERFDTITNDGVSGSIGSVSISPTRSTVNNWITFNVEDMPANATGRIEWRRLSGSIINIGSFTTDSSGTATGRFRVPATPGGPNQQISFIVGTTTGIATFEVAPRIKVLTDPAIIPGESVNVSLRGYAKQEQVRIRWFRPGVGWVTLGTVQTSNTGSLNAWVTVPWWAPDGQNSVRGDGVVFRQQTNVVNVVGGLQLAEETAEPSEATPVPENTPEASTPEPEETPLVIDRSALPQNPATLTQQTPAWAIDPTTGAVVATIDLVTLQHVSTVGWLVTDGGCASIVRIELSSDGVAWSGVDITNPAIPGVWHAIHPEAGAMAVRWVSSATDPAIVSGCLAEIEIWATPVVAEPTPAPTEPAPETETGTPDPASEETASDQASD